MGQILHNAGELPPLIEAVCQPAFHGITAGEGDIALLQTHISYLILAGGSVFKIKKPVRFSFLDFSTLALRRYYCQEELRLNRRLAGDVYRGVVGIGREAGRYQLLDSDDPRVEEVAIWMDRLPSDRMLASLLERGEADRGHVDAIVSRLVSFYAAAEAGGEVAAAGAPERLQQLIQADFDEMAIFRGDTVEPQVDDAVQEFCRSQLAWHADQLRRRAREGRVREGHGDLHADNICLTDSGVVIFDCIEFEPAFRCRDVASDIAFLAMDLEFHLRPDLARYLVESFSVAMHDPELPQLVPLFACHRAYIRGKVDSLQSVASEVPEDQRQRARSGAIAHFDLAYRLTWRGTGCLVVVMGLSGSGKSTLARRLRARIGAPAHQSDVIRKELAGISPLSRVGAGDESGLYGPAQSERTYSTMFARAAADLAGDRPVLLDATFLRRRDRDRARALALSAKVPVLFVECSASAAAVEVRLRARSEQGRDPSDADYSVYQRQRASYEPVGEDGLGDAIRVDSELPWEDALGQIEAEIRRIVLAKARGG